jgi:GrpB-like predicted nucleotidyltransferase (UPF0157 family)
MIRFTTLAVPVITAGCREIAILVPMKITIQPFQETWAAAFQHYGHIIQNALKAFNPAIEHIGSTSVPGLGAKPIIDIQVGLGAEADLDKIIVPMQQAGFTYFKKFTPDWPERRFFVKMEPAQASLPPAPVVLDENDDDSFRRHYVSAANVHVFVKDSHDWKRHLAFRDFLRAHDDVRNAYFNIKSKLSEREFKDMLEYNDHKDDFVKMVERQALEWYDQKG